MVALSSSQTERTGRVVLLDGPTPGAQVRDRIRGAILRCELTPNQALSVRDFAEQYRLRTPALVTVLDSLEREQLLTLRGNMAIIAPLEEAVITRAMQLWEQVSEVYMPRAFESTPPARLDKLERILRPTLGGAVTYAETQLTGSRFLTTLLAPRSTLAERKLFIDLCDVGVRYSICGGTLANALTSGASDRYIRAELETIALLRAGRVTAAVQNQQQLFRQLRERQRLALDYPQATDDQPIATVIPLRRRTTSKH